MFSVGAPIMRATAPLAANAPLLRSNTPSMMSADVASLLPAFSLAQGTFEDPTGIAQAFFFTTFVPQNFWLLIVFAPNWIWTRRIFEPLWPLLIVALAHLFIVVASAGQPPEAGTAPIELFNNLFNPVILNERGLDVYVELGTYKNFAAEEWTHELTWDLFVGRWIWLEGRRRNIFTSHSVLLTNLIGPPACCFTSSRSSCTPSSVRTIQPARWADPEALRTELEQGGGAAAAVAAEEPAAGGAGGGRSGLPTSGDQAARVQEPVWW